MSAGAGQAGGAGGLAGRGYLTGPGGGLLSVPMAGEARGVLQSNNATAPGPSSDRAFDRALERAQHAKQSDRATAPQKPNESPALTEQEARDAAERFVAQAMVLPILKQMRESTMMPEGGPFAPGQHEKMFAPLVDQRISEEITRSEGFGVVDAVARVLRTQAGEPVRRPDGGVVMPMTHSRKGL